MNFKTIKIFLISAVIFSMGFLTSYSTLSKIQSNSLAGRVLIQPTTLPEVLPAKTESTSIPNPTFSPTPSPIPYLAKNRYVIATIGDSMEETMGDSIDYTLANLRKKYPKTNFAMYNYGIGSENVTSGLSRFDAPFDHGTRHYPPIAEIKPDIIIVGSYAYNPLVPFDKPLHAAKLAELVDRSRRVSGAVYMLAEIAPLESGFGTGPGGPNWPSELANDEVQKITQQMENVFTVATQLSVPIIDVYHRSQKQGSIYGKPEYVGTHDHIHTSLTGQTFTADIITNTIVLK